MTLWKLAKSIAKDKSQDVEEVYKRLLKNQKKLRRMEDRRDVENLKKEYQHYNSRPLDSVKRVSKTQSRARS